MTFESITYRSAYQYGLLGVLVLLGVSMGLWQEIMGPTLPNLSAKLKVSYEFMGYAISLRSVGNILALIFVAIVYDSYPFLVHYFMFIECFLAGLITIIIPWFHSFWTVVLLFFIQSGCQNALNNGGQLTILRTFKEKSVGKMQIYHLGYAIGGVMSGLISQKFLKNTTKIVKLTKYCFKIRENITNTITMKNNITNSKSNERGFEYIYLIAGIFAISSAFLFFIFKGLRNPIDPITQSLKKESWFMKINPKYIANGNVLYGSIMTILLFSYYFFYIFGLLSFTPYIVVYAMDPCKSYAMSQHLATYLHTALNACFLLGRLIGSFLLDRNPIAALLVINSLNIIFNLILVFFSSNYSVALWIGACGMRLCNSIVYPSGTSIVNRYIMVTSCLISLALLGGTFGAFAGSSLGGYLVDNYPSNYITYSCCSGMSMLMIIIVLLTILGKKHEVRNFTTESNIKMELS